MRGGDLLRHTVALRVLARIHDGHRLRPSCGTRCRDRCGAPCSSRCSYRSRRPSSGHRWRGCCCAPISRYGDCSGYWRRSRWSFRHSWARRRILAGLAPNGVLRQTFELVGYHAPKRFRGLGASWLVLTLFTYPYVYLSVGARLAQVPRAAEESARLLGDSAWQMFVRVVLPMIRRSVLGGTLLVFLYSLSEFGAVQLLGYDTLTRVVYATRSGGSRPVLRRGSDAVGAGVRGRVHRASRAWPCHRVVGQCVQRPASGDCVGPMADPSRSVVSALILFFALAMPVASLVQWAWRGISQGDDSAGTVGDRARVISSRPRGRPPGSGPLAGVLTVLAVLPAALLSARYRSRLSTSVNVGGDRRIRGARSRHRVEHGVLDAQRSRFRRLLSDGSAPTRGLRRALRVAGHAGRRELGLLRCRRASARVHACWARAACGAR